MSKSFLAAAAATALLCPAIASAAPAPSCPVAARAAEERAAEAAILAYQGEWREAVSAASLKSLKQQVDNVLAQMTSARFSAADVSQMAREKTIARCRTLVQNDALPLLEKHIAGLRQEMFREMCAKRNLRTSGKALKFTAGCFESISRIAGKGKVTEAVAAGGKILFDATKLIYAVRCENAHAKLAGVTDLSARRFIVDQIVLPHIDEARAKAVVARVAKQGRADLCGVKGGAAPKPAAKGPAKKS